MTELPIIKHTGNEPADFSGVIYNDTGKNNYAAMINGQWLKRKDHKVRWFKSAQAARAAIRTHS
jgi:hypothetical protein